MPTTTKLVKLLLVGAGRASSSRRSLGTATKGKRISVDLPVVTQWIRAIPFSSVYDARLHRTLTPSRPGNIDRDDQRSDCIVLERTKRSASSMITDHSATLVNACKYTLPASLVIVRKRSCDDAGERPQVLTPPPINDDVTLTSFRSNLYIVVCVFIPLPPSFYPTVIGLLTVSSLALCSSLSLIHYGLFVFICTRCPLYLRPSRATPRTSA